MTAQLAHASTVSGCRLVSLDGHVLPLRSVDLTVDAGGGLARVRVRQQFSNPTPHPLGVTYQLPLPADAAVVDVAFVLDGRRIEGRVERTADARAAFERAVMEGRTAALLDQTRSSLFTQQLGNVPPGAVVEVEIDIEQPLAWRQGHWEWRFPTVVAPRFLGEGTADPGAVAVPVADQSPGIPCRVALSIDDAVTGTVASPSHEVRAEGSGAVVLGTLDRDVVVRWPVGGQEPGVRLEVARTELGDAAHGLLTMVPPAGPRSADLVPRDVILLLDTSGSMGGVPLQQLQAVCRGVIRGLSDRDRLEIVEFSRSARRWRPHAVEIDEGTRADALAFVSGLRASGGTHMHDGIKAALRPLRVEALRQVVLVTDGLIGAESKVVGHILRTLPAGCRVHTVGIGSAPNRSLTGPAARAGGGFEAIIGPDEPAEPVVEELLRRTGEPLVVDVSVSGSAVIDAAPHRIADLFGGCPARVALRLHPTGGRVVIDGRTAQGSFHRVLDVPAPAPGRRVVATRYAREKVEDLELQIAAGEDRGPVDAEIEALGLAYRISTRLTSWLAETERATVDPSAPTVHETVPQALPHAMSAQGVGLRRAMAQPVPSAAPMPRRKIGRAQSVRRPPGPREGNRHHRRRLEARADDEAAEVDALAEADWIGQHRGDDGAAPPSPVPTTVRRLSRRRRVRARVRSNADGTLVLEIDGPLTWDATGPLVLTLPDGRTVQARASSGTTRPTELAAGQRARLCLSWTGAVPVTILMSGLELEVTG